MASRKRIAEILATLGGIYPNVSATPEVAETWLDVLEGVSDVQLTDALKDWLRSDHEFAPRPGQLLKLARPVVYTAERIADTWQSDPVAREIAIRSGFLRQGESYGDDPPHWYAPAKEHDPIGYQAALRNLRNECDQITDSEIARYQQLAQRRVEALNAKADPIVQSLIESMGLDFGDNA